jgi:hypothetical protein
MIQDWRSPYNSVRPSEIRYDFWVLPEETASGLFAQTGKIRKVEALMTAAALRGEVAV